MLRITHTHTQTCTHRRTHTKNISIDSGDCLSGWVLYSLLTRRDVISGDCPVWHTHAHTWQRNGNTSTFSLIRGELWGCVCKNQNNLLNIASYEHTQDATNTHTHSTNQVSQAREVLTRFYGRVDALPSISGLSLPLLLFLSLRLYLSFFHLEVGTLGREVVLITAFY